MSFVSVNLSAEVRARFVLLSLQDAALARQALNSAVRKVGTWTRNEGLRRLSAGADITQANLKKAGRVTVKASGTGVFDVGAASGVFGNSFRLTDSSGKSTRTQTSVWIGTLPIKVIYKRAKVKQTRQGVVQGGTLYEHAFLALMSSGHLGVFRRDGTERLPIDEVADPIDATGIFSDIEPVVSQRLSDTLDHELDYFFEIRSAA